MTDLGTLGGESSFADGINDARQIVGTSYLADGTQHAFLYSDGVMVDLGTMGGPHSGVYDINNHGQVVGYSHPGNNGDERLHISR